MKPEERVDFEKKCHKEFGYSSKHIHYKLTDIETRLQRVEQVSDHSSNTIAGIILRLEGLVHALVKYVSDPKDFIKKIEDESDKIYNNNKDKKLIGKF